MKLQHNNNQYFVTLPKRWVENLGWQKGDDLTIEFNQEKHGVIVFHFAKMLKQKEKENRYKREEQEAIAKAREETHSKYYE